VTHSACAESVKYYYNYREREIEYPPPVGKFKGKKNFLILKENMPPVEEAYHIFHPMGFAKV